MAKERARAGDKRWGKEEAERLKGEAEDAASMGELEKLIEVCALAEGRVDLSSALSCAAFKASSECVRYLIPRSDPAADDYQALKWAAGGIDTAPGLQKERAACVRALAPVSSQEATDMALSLAAHAGRELAVEALIPGATEAGRASALGRAAAVGQTRCVELLAPPLDQAWGVEALKGAVKEARAAGRSSVAALLRARLLSHKEQAGLERAVKRAPAKALLRAKGL